MTRIALVVLPAAVSAAGLAAPTGGAGPAAGAQVRDVMGHIGGIGDPAAPETASDQLLLQPVAAGDGATVLAFANGRGMVLTGRTALKPRTRVHVALVRQGGAIAVYLNGHPEIAGEALFRRPAAPRLYVGGRHDLLAPLEGRLHDVAWYTCALSAREIARHFHAQRPATRVRERVTAEIGPPAGFTSVTLVRDDIDTTAPGTGRHAPNRTELERLIREGRVAMQAAALGARADEVPVFTRVEPARDGATPVTCFGLPARGQRTPWNTAQGPVRGRNDQLSHPRLAARMPT